jgi:hypothetical protein
MMVVLVYLGGSAGVLLVLVAVFNGGSVDFQWWYC